MTIHSEHPFAEPPDPVRRFRGRLGGAVSLWTAGQGPDRAGLTVSSLMVANGDPAAILGLLDPDSALFETLSGTGLGVVQLLTWADRDLADAFGGLAPAPGGPFRLGDWEQGDHGPVLSGRTHALVRLVRSEDVGWSRLVTATVDRVDLAEDRETLEHRRGRYRHRPAEPE
jgi:flavin reductase (DIM6/NTAB) family NADH-FMN oxidoreductase RutF